MMKELLNLDFLFTFMKVAEHKELKKVAEELYKSPSTISTQIKKLEEQTNSVLIDRTNHGIELTEKGKIVSKYAKKMIQLNDELFRKIDEVQISGTINIGIPTDYANLFAGKYLPRLKESLPNIEFKILCTRSRTLRKQINNNQLDVAIVSDENIKNNEYNLWKERMYWICGKNFNIHDYKKIPVAIFNDDCIVRDMALKSLEFNRINYKEIISSSVLDNIISFVRTNQAISFIPESYINTNDFNIMPQSFIPVDMELGTNLIFSESYDETKKDIIKNVFSDIKIDLINTSKNIES